MAKSYNVTGTKNGIVVTEKGKPKPKPKLKLTVKAKPKPKRPKTHPADRKKRVVKRGGMNK